MSEKGKQLQSTHGGKLRAEWQNNRLISSDGTNDNVLMGERDDGTNGFFVAKPGYNARDATPDQLIFNSNDDVFKIVDQGFANLGSGITPFPTPLTANSSNNFTMNTYPYTHNLGFVPQVILSRTQQSVGQYTAAAPGPQDEYMTGAGTGSTGLVIAKTNLFVDVSATAITFILFGSWSNSASADYTLPPFGGGTNYKFYLLQETAN